VQYAAGSELVSVPSATRAGVVRGGGGGLELGLGDGDGLGDGEGEGEGDGEGDGGSAVTVAAPAEGRVPGVPLKPPSPSIVTTAMVPTPSSAATKMSMPRSLGGNASDGT
jgi:hypothetical protein